MATPICINQSFPLSSHGGICLTSIAINLRKSVIFPVSGDPRIQTAVSNMFGSRQHAEGFERKIFKIKKEALILFTQNHILPHL